MTDKERIQELEDVIKHLKICIDGGNRDKQKYIQMLKAYEDELKKYMPEDEYVAFATKVAKISFFAEIMSSPNEEFRNIVLENWDKIVEGDQL